MSGNNFRRRTGRMHRKEAGVAAVEFAILAIVFFMLVFGVLELARAMYVFNTMHDATRYAANAASMTSHRDVTALNHIRQSSIFRTSPGELILGTPINDKNVRIDYMALRRREDGSMFLAEIPPGSLPTCPRRNREICMSDPNAANCIRFVRARICLDDDDSQCAPALFRPIVPLIPVVFDVPRATTIRPAESLGSLPEGTPCL